MKHTKRWMTTVITCALAVALLPADAWGAVQYMPDVTKEMSRAAYWSDKVGEPDEVLATADEIAQLNRGIWKTSSGTRDLANWSAVSYDAASLVRSLQSAAKGDAQYLWNSGARYAPDGSRASFSDLYDPQIALCLDPDVDAESTEPVMQEYLYAVCTTRTSLTVFPTDQPFQDDPSDPDFDLNYLTQVKVNEPLLLRTKSTPGSDGRFYYSALTSCGGGWIPADCVAICQDREEWLDAWHHPSDQLLVVCDDKIWTEDSNTQPETANRKLPMGTSLPLASEEDAQGCIIGRSAHNNYVVWMPVRRADGTYEKKLALISENRKVNEGYLPVTAENILRVALNQLGDVYGWGSMMGSDDCSGYIRDVYSCFGLDMPRSSDRNNGVMKTYDLRQMDDAQKAAFIRTLPPGTVLVIPGHEMLYLGYEGDKSYVISSVSNVRMPGASSNTRIRGAVISSLGVWRGNNTTWLHNLTTAMIPFYSADHPEYQVSIAKASVTGITDRDYSGRAQTQKPAVTLNGLPLTEGTDYRLSYKDNVKAGQASMTIEGIGSYRGTLARSFTIRPQKQEQKKQEQKKATPAPAPPAKDVKGTLLLKGVSKGKKTLKFTWTKVSGADGYDIFFAACTAKGVDHQFRKVRTVRSTQKRAWTKKGLKKQTSYKAYVKAYVLKNGKRSYVAKSPEVHVFTSGGDKRYTNPKSVRTAVSSTSLSVGKTWRINASVTKLKKSRKLGKHTYRLRYLSSDPKVASVTSSSGKVTARAKGKATIYVYAANGARKAVTVTVR